ncbi:MAG: nucleotidyltransferase domain-containing protein [Candidatus Omnitrophota bacterium]
MKEQLVSMLLKTIPDCRAIYRFGTWGTAEERPDSDLDLAVLPCTAMDSVRRWELAQQLACLAGRDVDLVDLLHASTVLRMQVLANGERLYCSECADVEIFEDLVFSEYARLNEERREILKDIRQRGTIYDK